MFKVSTTCCRSNQALLFQWLWVFLFNDHYAQFKRSSLKTKYWCQSQTVAITSNVKHVLYNANMCFEVSPGVINFNHHCICAFVDKICRLRNFTLLHLMIFKYIKVLICFILKVYFDWWMNLGRLYKFDGYYLFTDYMVFKNI